jgi:hypothetical protein
MHDRGLFWAPAPARAQAQFLARDVTIRIVSGLSQNLLSGPRPPGGGKLSGLKAPIGFSGVALGPTYAVAIAADRSLIVSQGQPPFSEGWDATSATAVTNMDDAFLVMDIEGPGLNDLVSKATTLDVSDASPSASLFFAGFACLAYRYERLDVLRLHIEWPLAAALGEWLRLA